MPDQPEPPAPGLPPESPKPTNPNFRLFWQGRLANAAAPEKPTTPAVEPGAEAEKTKAAQHVRQMRRFLAWVTVVTFWGELCGMFVLLLWQGSGQRHRHGSPFKLNDWLIGTVANGIILQTILVLIIIAADLFPKGGGKVPGGKEKEEK